MPPPPDSPFPEPRQIPGGTPGGSFPDHGIRAAAGSRIRITPEQLTLFREFFRGRPDVFALRGRPGKNGRAGYFPQCAGFWQDFCHRRKGTRIPCGECSFRKYLPPEAAHFMAHLLGQRPDCTDVMGIYPLDAQEMCRLLVFDFDNHQEEGDGNGGEAVSDQELREEVATLRRICESAGLPALTERSRSGRGYHVWIFFEQDTPGRTARLFGQALLNRGAEELPLKNFRYYDRMLPEQDTLPPDRKHPGKKGIGNLIALPLQGRALEKGNSAFIGPDWQPLPDQWATLASARKIAPDLSGQGSPPVRHDDRRKTLRSGKADAAPSLAADLPFQFLPRHTAGSCPGERQSAGHVPGSGSLRRGSACPGEGSRNTEPQAPAICHPVASATPRPMSVRDRTVRTPARSRAAYFSAAVPLPPEIMAPAWPMRFPAGAAVPAM